MYMLRKTTGTTPFVPPLTDPRPQVREQDPVLHGADVTTLGTPLPSARVVVAPPQARVERPASKPPPTILSSPQDEDEAEVLRLVSQKWPDHGGCKSLLSKMA